MLVSHSDCLGTYRITVVRNGVRACYIGLLEADERADRLLLVAPVVSSGLRHAVGVDVVLILGGGEASHSEQTEGESRTHDEVWSGL